MADIAKCVGKNCKVKKSCYRFTAPPSEYWQSYIMPNIKDGKCDMYWKNEKQKKKKEIEELVNKVWISPLIEQDKEMNKIKNNSEYMNGWHNGFNSKEIEIICKNEKK